MKTIKILLTSLVIMLVLISCQNKISPDLSKNLAVVASRSGSVPWAPWIDEMNDGVIKTDSLPWRPWGRKELKTVQWVQYDWINPVITGKIDVYLWDYYNVIPLPTYFRLLYWNGAEFVNVTNVSGLNIVNNKLITITFDEIQTTRLKLEADSSLFFIANVLEWEVYQAPDSPDHPPVISAGGDRDVMLGGKTYLSGDVKSVSPVDKVAWKTVSGPGKVMIEKPDSINSTASFSAIGEYLVTLTVTEGRLKSIDTLKVFVHQPPQEKRLDVVYTKRYKIDSPLWNKRAKGPYRKLDSSLHRPD